MTTEHDKALADMEAILSRMVELMQTGQADAAMDLMAQQADAFERFRSIAASHAGGVSFPERIAQLHQHVRLALATHKEQVARDLNAVRRQKAIARTYH